MNLVSRFSLISFAIFLLASCAGIDDPTFSGLSVEEIAAKNEREIAQWELNNPDVDLIRTPSGLAYDIFQDGNGVFPGLDDIITLDFDLFLGDGTAFTSTGLNGQPIQELLRSFVPGLAEGLQLLSVGGGGVFLIPGDLGFSQNFPDGINDDDLLIYIVTLVDINGEFAGAEENLAIETYLTENNLVPDTITESGVRMIFLEEGNGTFPSEFSGVTVDYHGTLLDGTIFDTTRDKESVSLSLENVIPGWREGIPLISEGGSAIMVIPSASAYAGNPPIDIIPPNSPLVFEVTLLDIL